MHAKERARLQEGQSRFAQKWREYQSGGNAGDDALERAFDLVKRFDVLSSDVYRVRSDASVQPDFRRRVEDFSATVSHEFSFLQTDLSRDSAYRKWVEKYRAVWRENFALFLFTLILFLGSLVVGWHCIVSDASFISVIVPQGMIEEILQKHRWFDDIQNNPFLDGLLIAVNNIKVGIYCFVTGAIFGVGGLALLAYNGVLFGAITAFCYLNGFHDQLGGFVVGHGPLELTIIVASTFASFIFGRVFYMRPYRLFGRRMHMAGADAGSLLSGILPWLMLAASIEVFVSPWPFIPMEFKIGIGLFSSVAFWAWTLWPARRNYRA